MSSRVPADPVLANEQPEREFNSDLLLREKDRELAKELFPEVYHILDHPHLREVFTQYDDDSNDAKKRVGRLGVVAVLLATIALLSSALSPLVVQLGWLPHDFNWLPLIIEIGGLVGAVVAAGGVWLSGKQKGWLEKRLMTERLRQWHFQMLIFKGKEIENSCNTSDPQSMERFCTDRRKWFSDFKSEYEINLDALLEDVISRPEAGYEWLHIPRTEYTAQSQVLNRIFEAYRRLRFRTQANYAAYKLQRSTDKQWWRPSSWPVLVLKGRAEALAASCFLGALMASAFAVVLGVIGYVSGVWLDKAGTVLAAVIVSFTILNMSVRAVTDGLAVNAEAERYRDYAGKIHYLLTQFDSSADSNEKLELMKEMERAAFEEFKGFLRVHREARFIP